MVAAVAGDYDVEITGVVTSGNASDRSTWPDAQVAIDFSTADAVAANARHLAARGASLVIGTTGWQRDEAMLRSDLVGSGVGVIAAPNFAIGVNIFIALAGRSAELLAARGFSPWIHESHHAAKKDAPSGTALAIKQAVEAAGGPVEIASTRAGHIPGTHTLGFDSEAEMITFTHTARDRTAFARGALEAARWINGRQGWFSMRDMLNL